MITVSVTQAKREFERLVDQVIAGEEVSITRWGKVVARLEAVMREPKRATAEESGQIDEDGLCGGNQGGC